MKKTFELIQGNDCCFLNFFISNEWQSIKSTKILDLEFFIILLTDLDSRGYRLFAKNENEIQEILEPYSSYTNEELSERYSGYVYVNKLKYKYLAILPAEKIDQPPRTFEFDFYDDLAKVCIKNKELYRINFWCERGVEKDDTLYSYFSLDELKDSTTTEKTSGVETLPQKKWWQFWK